MGTALARELARLKTLVRLRRPSPTLELLKADPANLLALAGRPPDPWQARLLRSQARRMLILCCRQAGKSTTGAALALRTALLEPGSLTLLLSPTLRQSGELFRKVTALDHALGRPVAAARETALTLELANGSRVVALPGDEQGVRGFSGPALVVLDEAARVGDALYAAVRPMLSTSGGALAGLTTPFGKRGWFFDAWASDQPWERVRVTAAECPRIPAAFLQEERRALGGRWYRQEYECSFEDAVDTVFRRDDILAALTGDVRPLFGE
jgi:hypothetical protein